MGFLTLEQCLSVLNQNSPRILDYEVNLDLFLAKTNDINKTLHANAVAARDRARLVAGMLLALAEDSALRINRSPRTLVGDVNSRIETLLEKHGKADFLSEVQLKLPANNENHRKYWSAIVETMQHLREMNIRSAINSGTDALGQFYETFLKYKTVAKAGRVTDRALLGLRLPLSGPNFGEMRRIQADLRPMRGWIVPCRPASGGARQTPALRPRPGRSGWPP